MAATKRRGREFWAKQAKAWKASGLSCTEFAEKAGLKPRTLSWWAWKLGAEASSKKPVKRKATTPAKRKATRAAKRKTTKHKVEPLEFIEVLASHDDRRIEIEIHGAIVRIPRDADPVQLAHVLEVLAKR